MTSNTIAFIGSGNMAGSLIGGLIADGYPAQSLVAADADPDKLSALVDRLAVRSTTDNIQAARQADVLVLAVKPQVLQSVARELGPVVRERGLLVISIAAGIREADLQRWLGGGVALVRVMPNTPALIRAGASAMHAGPDVSSDQKELAESILRAAGLVTWVDDEALMDAVTAVSGSGPAYFFLVMEAMEGAATAMGLPPETARLLVLQTALGAAKMAIESSDPPAILRRMVTSPGGTTEKALQRFADGGLTDLFAQALSDARDRSIELARELGGADG